MTSLTLKDIAFWFAIGLALIATCLTIFGIRYIYRTTAIGAPTSSFPPWKKLIDEFQPLILGFSLLAVLAFFMYGCFWLLNYSITIAANSLARGFLASLIEDIFFFLFVGFLVIIVQKREFEKNSNIDYRIDSLFNAGKLTSSELDYIKHSVARIGCDFKWNETFIDIIGINDEKQCIKVDVSRRFHVANYFNDIDCVYEWKIEIHPDKVEGLTEQEPMRLFPLFRKRLGYIDMDENGKPSFRNISADSDTLQDALTIPDNEHFQSKLVGTKIAPSEICEFRMRYSGWQPLHLPDGSSKPYEIESERHWDKLEVTVRNSLDAEVKVKIAAPAGERTVTIGPGDQVREAASASDMPRNAKVLISFMVD